MSNVNQWIKNIDLYRTNPAAIQRQALAQLEAAENGQRDVVDPTNPFVFLMEAASTVAAAGMIQNAAESRNQYPSLAQTEDEVYRHMSDADYIGRFASPARATMILLLGKEDLYARAVETGVGNIRKLTIPRHTEFSVAGVQFTMQYPIDIRIMAHGGLQIVYNTDTISPLQTLATNMLDWEAVNISGMEFIRIHIPVNQFKITTQTASLNQTTGFAKSYTFTDQYYYARVYYADTTGAWREMKTTHSDQVYDPLKPTAVLKVTSGKLHVTIPQVYLTTQLVNTELRVDIYTTRGPMDLLLSNYTISNFSVKWIDLDGTPDSSRFIAPLSNFPTYAIYSSSTVNGGTNGITFEALRERVMKNALGSPNLPITNVQVTTRLEDMGYEVVKDVDNVTNRQFLATRLMPRPTDNSTVSGAGATIQTLTAAMSDLVEWDSVMDNGLRITLLPSTLYQNVNGLVQLVPQSLLDALAAMPVDVRARRVNESRYLYSPFHYVLDMTEDMFEHRAYYLDGPVIETKSFVEENDTTGISVSVAKYQIDRVEDGYLITIVCRSQESWKNLSDAQVYCQISYRPANERDRAYQNGTLVGLTPEGDRIYTFLLGTNYDLDSKDNIVLTTFQMYDDEERKHATPLVTDFDIMFIASGIDPEGLEASNIDLEMGRQLLPVDAVGISRERLKVRMGDALHGLWASSRTVASSQDYQRYAADVPALWEETVYVTDPLTGAMQIVLNGDELEYEVLHEKDSPMLDNDGLQIYKHRKGDVMLDSEGHPIIINTRQLVRQVDLFFLDGIYWFADEAAALTYKASLPATVVGWLNNDIAAASQFLLEQTDLYFYPKSTLGQITAIVQEDQRVQLQAEQSFAVTFYLAGVAYRDAALRVSLSRMAVETIDEALRSNVVTLNGISKMLTDRAGGDAIGVQVSGLGGANPQPAVTLEDGSARLAIKKLAVALPDGTIGVEDDVAIAFIQHTAN